MKHAGPAALDALEDLLAEVRVRTDGAAALKEKKRGTFYRKGSGFLHFHEDPAGFFADLKEGEDFRRYPVNTPAERRRFLAAITVALRFAAGCSGSRR